jgi:hypothetical protein
VVVPTVPQVAKGSKRGLLVAVAVVVVLVLVAGIAVVLTRGGDPDVTADGPTTTVASGGDQGGDGQKGEGSGDDGNDGGDRGNTESVISDELPSDDITLTDDVVVVNSERGSMFKGYSSDGTALMLDPSAENVDQLEAGKILLLSGITVVRVASVDTTDEGIIVTGEPATLPEVIADGELEWNDVGLDAETARLFTYDDEAIGGSGGGSGGGSTGGGSDDELTEEEILEEGGGGIVDGLGGNGFRADPASATAPAASFAPRATPASVAVGSKTISGKVNEFSFDLTYEPTGGSGHHIKLDLTGTGDLAGTLSVDVNVGSLASSGGAVVAGRQVKQFDFELAELGGDATITTDLQSTKQLTSVMTPPFLKVPFGIEFPALVGGIPFTLSLTGTIQVQLSFALAGATLSGEAQITFGGDAGFHFKDGSLTVAGQRVQDAPDLLSKLAGGGSGPVGVVLTSELPKVGFGFGFLQTGAGVYLSSGMVASQTILPPPPSCHSMQVAYVLAGGIEAKFLGKEFDLGRKAVVDKRWDYTVPPTAQCTAK